MKNATPEPTHKITYVEPVYMPDLLKEQMKSKDVKSSFVTVVLSESTVLHIYEALSNEFEECKDFKGCLRLAETCKDLHFDEKAGDILKYIETAYPDEYRNYKQGANSDYSSANGKEV